MSIDDLLADLVLAVPLSCANCAERFVAKEDGALCPNCGEEPTWDPPACDEHLALEAAAEFLPPCPVCDSLLQDYESNKALGSQGGGA